MGKTSECDTRIVSAADCRSLSPHDRASPGQCQQRWEGRGWEIFWSSDRAGRLGTCAARRGSDPLLEVNWTTRPGASSHWIWPLLSWTGSSAKRQQLLLWSQKSPLPG